MSSRALLGSVILAVGYIGLVLFDQPSTPRFDLAVSPFGVTIPNDRVGSWDGVEIDSPPTFFVTSDNNALQSRFALGLDLEKATSSPSLDIWVPMAADNFDVTGCDSTQSWSPRDSDTYQYNVLRCTVSLAELASEPYRTLGEMSGNITVGFDLPEEPYITKTGWGRTAIVVATSDYPDPYSADDYRPLVGIDSESKAGGKATIGSNYGLYGEYGAGESHNFSVGPEPSGQLTIGRVEKPGQPDQIASSSPAPTVYGDRSAFWETPYGQSQQVVTVQTEVGSRRTVLVILQFILALVLGGAFGHALGTGGRRAKPSRPQSAQVTPRGRPRPQK